MRGRPLAASAIMNHLPNDQLSWLKQNMPKELHIAPQPAVTFYAFNTTKPPFNVQRVRQALAMAIDREVLVEKVTRGGELPAYGLVPDGIANYTSQKVSWAKMSQADRDVAAIKLMSEAGYGPRNPLNKLIVVGLHHVCMAICLWVGHHLHRHVVPPSCW